MHVKETDMRYDNLVQIQIKIWIKWCKCGFIRRLLGLSSSTILGININQPCNSFLNGVILVLLLVTGPGLWIILSNIYGNKWIKYLIGYTYFLLYK